MTPVKWRDKFVWAACNALINKVASRQYAGWLRAVILLGSVEVHQMLDDSPDTPSRALRHDIQDSLRNGENDSLLYSDVADEVMAIVADHIGRLPSSTRPLGGVLRRTVDKTDVEILLGVRDD